MRNLLERAKPQLLAALENQKIEYPSITKEVEDHLTRNYFVSDIRYATFMDLRSLWMQSTKQLIDSPWEFFEED
jgi:hypothetical protein